MGKHYKASETIDAENASAIMGFVDTLIGALESGFIEKNNPRISEIHQAARNYVKDKYGSDFATIQVRWGNDVANLCGLEEDLSEVRER